MVRIFSTPCSSAIRSNWEKVASSSDTVSRGASRWVSGVNPTMSAKRIVASAYASAIGLSPALRRGAISRGSTLRRSVSERSRSIARSRGELDAECREPPRGGAHTGENERREGRDDRPHDDRAGRREAAERELQKEWQADEERDVDRPEGTESPRCREEGKAREGHDVIAEWDRRRDPLSVREIEKAPEERKRPEGHDEGHEHELAQPQVGTIAWVGADSPRGGEEPLHPARSLVQRLRSLARPRRGQRYVRSRGLDQPRAHDARSVDQPREIEPCNAGARPRRKPTTIA